MAITIGRAFDAGAVSIGRAMPRRSRAGSPLGNPFIIDRDGTRDQVSEKYRVWLTDQLTRPGPVRQEFDRLLALARQGDLHLGCGCSPAPCPGDVIKDLLEAAE